MILSIAFLLFFIGCTRIYTGVQDLYLLGNAVETTATVTEIEEVITEDEHRSYYAYFLHLKLPDYCGRRLGKIYETPVAKYQYSVGETVAILQNRNAPTEILLKIHANTQTLAYTFQENVFFLKRPTFSISYNQQILFGLFLILCSFSGCFVITPLLNRL